MDFAHNLSSAKVEFFAEYKSGSVQLLCEKSDKSKFNSIQRSLLFLLIFLLLTK